MLFVILEIGNSNILHKCNETMGTNKILFFGLILFSNMISITQIVVVRKSISIAMFVVN